MIEELKKQIHDKRLLKERIENMPQRAREFLFTRGEKFRDRSFKDFGYEYPQSWLLFDEDELAEALDDYETSQEIYTLYKMQAESIEKVKELGCIKLIPMKDIDFVQVGKDYVLIQFKNVGNTNQRKRLK